MSDPDLDGLVRDARIMWCPTCRDFTGVNTTWSNDYNRCSRWVAKTQASTGPCGAVVLPLVQMPLTDIMHAVYIMSGYDAAVDIWTQAGWPRVWP